MKEKVNTLPKNFGVILVLILSFWAVKPLFAPGFFPMHDDTQVARVFEMAKALKDGMFPVRWVSDLGYGYGYPIFNFYAPLAYYFGGFLTVLGLDALAATKAMFVVGILLSGIFMYLLVREFWGELGGVVSGLFYVYAPYHAVDIYVRGDIAEVWAYAFIPLMFYGFYKVYMNSQIYGDLDTEKSKIKNQKSKISPCGRSPAGRQFKIQNGVWKWVAVGSFGYAGIILSHNLTAMMVTPFLLIVMLLYCYIAYRNKRLFTIHYSLFTILLGLALSAFYWFPALAELKYTNVLSQIGGGANFRDHFVCIQQLWNSQWGFGGSIPGCIDGMSFKIGKLHILVASVSLLMIGMSFRVNPAKPESRGISHNPTFFMRDPSTAPPAGGLVGMTSKIVWLSFLGFIISVFFTLEISKPIWEAVPVMAFFQYPWRFLILVSFFSSLLGGFVVWFFQTGSESVAPFRWSWFVSIVVIFLLIYPNSKLFQPQTVVPRTSSDYTNELALKWTTSKISDEYMPKDFKKPKSLDEIVRERIIVVEGKPEITIMTNRANELRFLIDSQNRSELKLNIAYFPAWHVFSDNQKIAHTILENGLLIKIPEGKHEMTAKFVQTPIEKIASTLSVIGMLIVSAGIILITRSAKLLK